ncbi:MAG: hypothetical protein D6761_08565, partial [Candidatus Dadabacteria bacterium]
MIYRWAVLWRSWRLTFTRRYFSLRFLAWMIFIMIVKHVAQWAGQLVRLFDEVLFPQYRKASLGAPIYIVA